MALCALPTPATSTYSRLGEQIAIPRGLFVASSPLSVRPSPATPLTLETTRSPHDGRPRRVASSTLCPNLKDLRVDMRRDDSRLSFPPGPPRSKERAAKGAEPSGHDLQQLVEPSDRRQPTRRGAFSSYYPCWATPHASLPDGFQTEYIATVRTRCNSE